MAESDIFLSISTRVEMTGILLIKSYFDTLLRNTLAVLYMFQIISLLLSVSCAANKESGNTQYFI